MQHDYLRLTLEQRRSYLHNSCTIDDMVVLLKDLRYIGVECPILSEALATKSISIDNHILPIDFFHPILRHRRLPTKVEYGWKRGTYLALKFSFVPAFLMAPAAGVAGNNGLVICALAMIFMLLVPLFFSWTNLFYRPLQYTLVRPFNDGKFSRPLKRFILRNVGLRCLGIGLSDRHLMPNALLGIYHFLRWPIAVTSVILGGSLVGIALIVAIICTWVRQSIRIIDLRMPSAFLHIQPALLHRRKLTAKHFVCGGQCFNIRCIHEVWQYAIQVLFHEADFVLVDLSCVRPASDWEIKYLKHQNRIANCIPICQVGHDAPLVYKELFNESVVYYDRKGRLNDSDDFLGRIERAVAHRSNPSDEPKLDVPISIGQSVLDYRPTECTAFRRFTWLRLLFSLLGGLFLSGALLAVIEAVAGMKFGGQSWVAFLTLSCQAIVFCFFTWLSFVRSGRPLR